MHQLLCVWLCHHGYLRSVRAETLDVWTAFELVLYEFTQTNLSWCFKVFSSLLESPQIPCHSKDLNILVTVWSWATVLRFYEGLSKFFFGLWQLLYSLSVPSLYLTIFRGMFFCLLRHLTLIHVSFKDKKGTYLRDKSFQSIQWAGSYLVLFYLCTQLTLYNLSHLHGCIKQQLGVQHFHQGYFGMQTGRTKDRTSNLIISSNALPLEPRPLIHCR